MRVRIEGREGNLISTAGDLVQFQLGGEGKVLEVNNGLQTSHEPFWEAYRKGISGVWLTVAFAMKRPRRTVPMATAEGPSRATIVQVRAKEDCRLCIARGVPALHVGRRGLKRGEPISGCLACGGRGADRGRNCRTGPSFSASAGAMAVGSDKGEESPQHLADLGHGLLQRGTGEPVAASQLIAECLVKERDELGQVRRQGRRRGAER